MESRTDSKDPRAPYIMKLFQLNYVSKVRILNNIIMFEGIKICDLCKSEFYYKDLLKNKTRKDGVRNRCNTCETKRKKNTVYYREYKERMREEYKNSEECRLIKRAKRKKYHINNMEAVLWSHAKIRAKNKKLDFNLKIEDIIIPKLCPILNIPLVKGNIKRSNNSPSVDRIDNSKGYTKKNIKVISYLANHMKAHATKEQLLLFAANIIKYLNNDEIVRPI